LKEHAAAQAAFDRFSRESHPASRQAQDAECNPRRGDKIHSWGKWGHSHPEKQRELTLSGIYGPVALH
jgi:hypothetical protein